MALSPTHPGVGAPSADGRRTTRGLLPLLFTGNTAMYALYLGVGGVLLPLQVEQLDAAHKVANLGLVSGVAAIFATFFNPLAGALSDRSGRRNPWILGGGLATVAAMALLGSVDTVLLVAIAWCLGQAVMNFYQSALTSVVPDRVPLGRRGAASAAVGLGLPVGSTVGVLVASACSDHYRTGYLVLGVLVALAAVLFTSAAREQRMPAKSPTRCASRPPPSSGCCASTTSAGPSSAAGCWCSGTSRWSATSSTSCRTTSRCRPTWSRPRRWRS
ncbi:MFS transporter [Kitasatospora gansuensis]